MTQLNTRHRAHGETQHYDGPSAVDAKLHTGQATDFLVFLEDATAMPVDRFTCREVAEGYARTACVTLGAYTPLSARVHVYAPNCDAPERQQALLCMVATGRRLGDLTHEALIEHVLDQVISSSRIEGITLDRDTLRASLYGRLSP